MHTACYTWVRQGVLSLHTFTKKGGATIVPTSQLPLWCYIKNKMSKRLLGNEMAKLKHLLCEELLPSDCEKRPKIPCNFQI